MTVLKGPKNKEFPVFSGTQIFYLDFRVERVRLHLKIENQAEIFLLILKLF